MAGEMTIFGQAPDARDATIAELQADNKRLRAQVTVAQADAEQAHRDTARSLSALRQQLTPLYRALQMVFGELDAVGVDDTEPSESSAGASHNPRVSAVWDLWKKRLSGGCGKVIDALMVHSNLNTQQLAIATGLHRTTIPKLIYELNKAGLINKSGGRFSLKQL